MAIGTSTGAYFDNALHMAANPYVEDPASTPDNNEVSPGDVQDKKEFQKGKPIRASERLYVSPNDNRALGASQPDVLSSDTSGQGLTVDRAGIAGETPQSNVEDRRNQSLPDMLSSWVGEQLTPEKMQAILQHPEAKPWQTETANQPGLQSIPPVNGARSVTDKLFGVTGDRYQTWPERALRASSGALNSIIDSTISSMAQSPEKIAGAVTLPGDMSSGKVKPGSQEEIERSADLASIAVGAPAPVASRMAEGTLGSFAGVGSRTVNKALLEHAEKMEADHMHPNDIWEMTGFFKGAEGKWRYEIPDDKASLINDKLKPGYTSKANPDRSTYYMKESEDMEGHKLTDVLHHPELFKAYPHLKDVNVKPVPPEWTLFHGIKGGFDPEKNLLYVGSDTKQGMLSTIMHEVQHGIQSKEGFEPGTNTLMFQPKDLQQLFAKYSEAKVSAENDVKDLIGLHGDRFANLPSEVKKTSVSQVPKGWGNQIGWEGSKEPEDIYRNIAGLMRTEMKSTEVGPYGITSSNSADNRNLLTMIRRQYPEVYDKIQNIVKSDEVVNDKKNQLYELYRRTKGEVESRNVQTRLNMENLDRYSTHPFQTEDRPRFVQHSAPDKVVGGLQEHNIGENRKYPVIPKNAAEELEQLMETRRTNKLMGYDVNSPDYKYYNDRISELQAKLKKK